MEQVTVLVTSVGGIGEQILKALRLAEKTRYTIVGCDMSPQTKGLLDVDHPYLVPPARDPSYVNSLLKVCRRHRVAAILPGSEPELKVLSEARQTIEDAGLFLPISPASVIDLCLDKVKTCEFLAGRGFAVSAYKSVSSVEDLQDFDTLPAVLKPSKGGSGSAHVYLAQTREEFLTFGRYLLGLYPEFVTQAYVGTPDAEFTVGVLCDMEGGLINSIAVKRNILTGLSNRLKVPNRTGRAELGPTLALSSGISQGVIGRFPEVTETCERIAKTLACRGAINVQCRHFEGKIYVFEINPRFSGTTSLRALAGYNEPDVLIRRHVFGEKITPHFPYQSGIVVRGLTEAFMKELDFPTAKEL